MEDIMKDSLEHLSPLIDFPLWEDRHLYTSLNSPAETLFEYEPFECSINSFNAFDVTNGVAESGGHSYEQLHRRSPHPSALYTASIPSPCIHDINDSDEFWKDIVNNVDHTFLAEKCSTDYCNSITDIFSSTPPLEVTDNLYSKPSSQELDSTLFSMKVNKAENRCQQESNSNSCFLDSSRTFQGKKISVLSFNFTPEGYNTSEEFGKQFKVNKAYTTNNLPSNISLLNLLTYENENNDTNTLMKYKNEIYLKKNISCTNLLPRIADSQFLVGNKKSDSTKEMNFQKLNTTASLKHYLDSAFTNTDLNCSNLRMDPRLELEFHDKMNTVAVDTHPSENIMTESKLKNFAENMQQNKVSNCSNLIIDPKLKFHDQISTGVADTHSSVIPKCESKRMHFIETSSPGIHESASPKSLAEKRKPNKLSVSRYKSVSSIKIDKKGSFLSLPTNSLSTLMVKDLLQMSGCKNERSIKELAMEYRANVVKIMQQKQLRLRRMDAPS